MNTSKTICIIAWLLTALTAGAAEKTWIDVTNQYITNPQFTNDSQEGWSWESNASTQAVRIECISFYSGNFDLHQQLRKLPQGHYRLSVQGFYRMADNSTSLDAHQNGTEDITASLYAGEKAHAGAWRDRRADRLRRYHSGCQPDLPGLQPLDSVISINQGTINQGTVL